MEMVESLNFFLIGDCSISLFRSPLSAEALMMGPMQSGLKFTDRIVAEARYNSILQHPCRHGIWSWACVGAMVWHNVECHLRSLWWWHSGAWQERLCLAWTW